jgi:hypothetical protein
MKRACRRAGVAFLMLNAAFGAEAGRIEGAQLGTAAQPPSLGCPPKIVPKCKPGWKPYCAEFSGKCCRTLSCRAPVK